VTKVHDAFVYENLYNIIAFRGAIATAITFVLMLAFVLARDAFGLIKWGMPPRDREDGVDRGTSSGCEMSPDHSGH
jgi:hypothetical protein